MAVLEGVQTIGSFADFLIEVSEFRFTVLKRAPTLDPIDRLGKSSVSV